MKLLKKIKHWFVHDWSKWGAPVKTSVCFQKEQYDSVDVQERECAICGAIQGKIIKITR